MNTIALPASEPAPAAPSVGNLISGKAGQGVRTIEKDGEGLHHHSKRNRI